MRGPGREVGKRREGGVGWDGESEEQGRQRQRLQPLATPTRVGAGSWSGSGSVGPRWWSCHAAPRPAGASAVGTGSSGAAVWPSGMGGKVGSRVAPRSGPQRPARRGWAAAGPMSAAEVGPKERRRGWAVESGPSRQHGLPEQRSGGGGAWAVCQAAVCTVTGGRHRAPP